MVCDDQIEAKLARPASRFGSTNAAIDRDDHVDTLGMQTFEGRRL